MTFHPAIEFYQRYGEPSPKTEELAKLFVQKANGAYGSAEYVELLRSIDERQKTLASFGGTFQAELKARLVIGMSQGRLWGNGFQFHPVYGIPYLPASGIKGALRHFLAEEGQTQQNAKIWFGDEEQRGSVTLFDAFPSPGPKKRLLAEEILNKHHADYYEKEAARMKPPADYNEPMPVKFVAVAAGVKFRFVYGAPAGMLEDLKGSLVRCLDLAGMGAKTRKGYGRMVPSPAQ